MWCEGSVLVTHFYIIHVQIVASWFKAEEKVLLSFILALVQYSYPKLNLLGRIDQNIIVF